MAVIGNMLMTAEEMSSMKQIFEEMDTDQNGYLSLEELKVGV